MKKLLILSTMLCIITATMTGCSENTAPENNTPTDNGQDTASSAPLSVEEETEEYTDVQPASPPVSTENQSSAEEAPAAESDPHSVDRLSLGGSHSGFVTEDGSLYVWGCGFEFQLGNNEHTIAESPIKILDDVEKIDFGFENSAAITRDGSLYIWGKFKPVPAEPKELFINPGTPTKVMDDVKAVSLGDVHTAVIKNDNALYMWGVNSKGCLGNETYDLSDTPVKVMDDVSCVSLGFNHSAAVTSDGSLYTWGCNTYGQLGNGKSGENEAEAEPVKIMDNVQYVSLGGQHSAAVTKDGSLYMWGKNDYGQIGNGKSGENEIQPEPVKIMDNVQYVSLGMLFSAAVTKDGSLYMWGENGGGQLGNGESGNKALWTVPIKIMDNVAAVSLGNEHSGALTKDGELYMWGNNSLNAVGETGTDNLNISVPTKINITGNS